MLKLRIPTLTLTLLIALSPMLAAEKAAVKPDPAPAPAPAKKAPPRVEVAFVVDTTGSMSGLIAAAKAKIWGIANQIVLGKPKPVVRMALVAYRDKHDAYVTKVFDLTDNIDQVYTDLMTFQAGGGGDTPENVNQALHDAVHKLKWSRDKNTLKIIYLVGDCPPHNEYKDVPTYDKIAKEAIEKGIYVNTILCGSNAQAKTVWQDIARRAEGSFLNISAGGGAERVPTPYDGELAKLNAELTGTVVVYGEAGKRRRLTALSAKAAEYERGAAADRASFAAASGKAASGDLLDALREKKVDLAKVKKENLPEPMQKMTVAEQKKYLAKQQAQRDEITKKIKEISAKRAAFLKAKLAEMAKTAPAAASFDGKVVETLRRQAERKGISYDKK